MRRSNQLVSEATVFEFNNLREMYLKELAALRSRYAALFVALILGGNINEPTTTTHR